MFALNTQGRAILADGTAHPLPVHVEQSTAGDAQLLEFTVTNDGPTTLLVDVLEFASAELGAMEVEVFRQGFFMPSDPSGFALLRIGEPVPSSGHWRPKHVPNDAFWSHSLVAFRDGPQADCVLVGFCAAERYEGYAVFQTDGERIRLSLHCALDGGCLEPGQSIRLEPLMVIQSPDVNHCLDLYAKGVAKRHNARIPSATATGWIDWQYYREEKTEDDILRSTRALSELKKKGYPFEFVVVDGGWCNYASEWLEPCDKFPRGMKQLSADVEALGLRLGLWLAPYLTNVETRVAREHPEWLVTDATTGEPLHGPGSPVGEYYVLDYSVPEAQNWLRNVVRTMVRDWKIGYLKLDGPRYAAYRGGRFHDSNMTASQVIRRSLEIIREECGDDVIVEGEGCYLPSVGLVDTQRTTQDNWIYWYHPVNGTPAMKENLKNDLLSGFLHGRFWHNHRENVILRDWPSPYTHLKHDNPARTEPLPTEAELQSQISAMALTGGALLLTDPMDELRRRPERLRLARTFLPHFEPTRCRPIDTFTGRGTQPSIYVTDVERDYETWHVVAVYNWDDHTADFTIPLAKTAGSGDWHAFEFWTQCYLGLQNNDFQVTDIPAHGCRVIALRKDLRTPQLLGTNLHLLQGAVDIESCAFAGNTLKIVVSHFCQTGASVTIRIPDGYCYESLRTTVSSHLVDTRQPGIVTVHFDSPPLQKSELQITSRSS